MLESVAPVFVIVVFVFYNFIRFRVINNTYNLRLFVWIFLVEISHFSFFYHNFAIVGMDNL